MSTYLNINAIKDGSIPNSKLEENYVVQEEGKQLSTNDFTDTLKSKLESLYNYDDTDIQNSIQLLSDKLEILFGESGTDAIETFNEIIKFLENIDDSESLDSIIKSIEQQITQKQDVISDLSTIRSNASKGAVAEQNAKNYTNFEIDKLTPSVIVNDNTIAVQVGAKQSEEVIVPYAKFANDLTGRIEATPEEFTFRPSAGDKSIRDESAFIKRIKGNTIVWNQLGKDLWNIQYGTGTRENNNYIISTISGQYPGIYCNKGSVTPLNHKILVTFRGRIEGYTNPHFYINYQGSNNSTIFYTQPSSGLVSLSAMFTCAYNTNAYCIIFTDQNTTNIQIVNPQIFDLTQMFGAGNEPTTIEEFYERLPMNIDPYAYNGGELLSVNVESIVTNGFNQWDEEWTIGYMDIKTGELIISSTGTVASKNYISVLPDVDYYFNFPVDPRIAFYDQNKKFINCIYTNSKGLVHTPLNAHYIRFSCHSSYGRVYRNDICINLSHTGYRNGEYEPYKEFTRELDVIKKYFPDGMRSAGTAYDEITSTKAITRIGVVDLGELSWGISSNGTLLYSTHFGVEINCKRGINVFCQKYDAYSWTSAPVVDKTISMEVSYTQSGRSSVMVRDSAYTDAAAFRTAMSGVMLYYELAEPIEVEFDEVVDLTYNVYDFGTEKIISSVPTTQFRGDIIYQFNATDTIRQNKNNISKIVSKVQEIDNALTSKQNKLIVETLPNGNIKVEGIGEFMAATPSGSPQHALYEAMGAKWNATTGYWELNGINDLTNADMAKVPDMRTNLIFTNGQYALANFRTNVWAKYLYTPIKTILANVFRNNTALEVLILNSASSLYDVESTGQIAAFYGCSKLRVINGKIKLAWLTANMFDRCTMLEEVRLSALNDNIRFDASPKLSKQSLLYLIENAAPTTAITITVHADVYAWASTDAEVQAALAAQPLVTLISA